MSRPLPPPPPTYPGEKHLSTWPDAKFNLSFPPTDWATFSIFQGHGLLHLTTCRLVLHLHPSQHSTQSIYFSIPLLWLKKDKLQVRRPFFDSLHLSGLFVPVDVMYFPAFSSINAHGKPVQFRIDLLDEFKHQHLCDALHVALDDMERVAAGARNLRKEFEKTLIKTQVHYAFVDPTNPSQLHLATQLAYPQR